MRIISTLKKTVAITLILCILNNLILPGIAFALTSGPQNPDATSFEPIDTTDMVNLLSGDLAYNIPLIEVPGPEGGYPLALSYHAGIMPDEEASWVGLGWSLNAGAINRNVSGFPDDFNGQQSVVRDYWKGGSRTVTSVGVNVGVPGLLSYDFGVSIGHDTFLGTGIGGYAEITAGWKVEGGMKAGASIGLSVDPFGGLSLTGDVGLGRSILGITKSGSLNAGIGLGFSANANGINVGAGVGISASIETGPKSSMSQSLLGASISSGGGGVSVSVGGTYNSVSNVNAGRIQTKSSGWGFKIPIVGILSLSLKQNYIRYWSDESASVYTYGALNYPKTREVGYGTEFDTYYLADVNDANYNLLDKNDPIKSTGGSFPDYDNYSVLGQGISGSIRPYGYQLEVFGKGKYVTSGFVTNRQYIETYDEEYCDYESFTGEGNNCYTVTYTNTFVKNPDKLNFRFMNDFSNSYRQQNGNLTNSSHLDFDLNPVYGNNDGTDGYDPAAERLASSKNVEYFTNDEIKNGSAKLKGFINTQAAGFDRTKNADGTATVPGDIKIGGFMITNESGVTYHYALPVYSYEEDAKTENVSGVNTYNEQKRKNPYAASWLLTAVTGPDYVDVNNNGYVDKGDWGYWVSFEYGKWSGNYSWRNPGIGYRRDLDTRFKYHATGKKELYYLDAIVTPSHTAIFEKEIRADGKGMLDDGAVNPYIGRPTTQLRLKDVILLKNSTLSSDLNTIRQSGVSYGSMHLAGNVIDKSDITANPALITGSIKKINFGYDYSLCPNTPNSFDEDGSLYTTAGSSGAPGYLLGKLTLNSLSFLGKGGVASIPPMTFDYELPTDLVKQSNEVEYINKKTNSDIYRFIIPSVTPGGSNDFKEGDITTFDFNGTTFYAIIKQVADVSVGSSVYNRTVEVKFLAPPAVFPTGHDKYSWKTTKNPPYLSENYDMWGLFKADYQSSTYNEILSRLPSKASAQSVDVWSLRRVHHAMGMTTDIVYESDVYNKVALYRNASIQVATTELIPNSTKIKLATNNYFGVDLRDFISIGDKVKANLHGSYTTSEEDPWGSIQYNTFDVNLPSGEDPSLAVTEVGDNYLIVDDQNFYNQVNSELLLLGGSISSGNVSAGGIGNNYGGGVRIKKVVNNEPVTAVTMAVNYNYNRPEKVSLSSGTTSYEPVGIDVLNLRSGNDDVLKSFSKLLGVVREVPAPGVMYEYVSVSSERTVNSITTQQLGKTQYQFEIFNSGMIGLSNKNPVKNSTTELSTILLQNNTSRVGNLRRVIKYDSEGNKLSEVISHYLHDEQTGQSAASNESQYENLLARYNKQGVIMERTAEGRYNDGKSRYVMSTRATYPTILTGTTTIDYKTGLRTDAQTLAFDFYSGQPVKTLSSDSYGNRFVSQITPAYRIYPEMGLKFKNVKYGNMLSQTAEEIVYKVDQDNTPTAVLSAEATTWSNQLNMLNSSEAVVNTQSSHSSAPNIWRKNQSYQWMPQERAGGLTSIAGFKSFFNGGSSLTDWNLVSQITLYNIYSNALEVFDMNGNYSTTKMGYNQTKIVANASPANYNEMTFAGMEDETISTGILARNVTLGSATIINGISHTGDYSASLPGKQTGLYYLINTGKLKTGRNYTASVWMKASGSPLNSTLYYMINGGTKVTASVDINKKAGDWYLVTLQIPGSVIVANAALQVGCINNDNLPTYIDDFRFKPLNADMVSYVYDLKTGELNYKLDNNNLFTKFQYDTQGRLTKVYKETFKYGIKPITEYAYNYATPNTSNWRATGNYRCQQVNGANTGLKEIEQSDISFSSTTFGNTRWVVTGSASECAANPSSCVGLDKKYINGNCETGVFRYTRTVLGEYDIQICYGVYSFSDGTSSAEFEVRRGYSPCVDY